MHYFKAIASPKQVARTTFIALPERLRIAFARHSWNNSQLRWWHEMCLQLHEISKENLMEACSNTAKY